MKKKNVFSIIGLISAFCILFFVAWNDCHYYREGYIVHTVFNNLVIFVDDTGNEWDLFTDGQPFVDGQNVKVLMFDNYTPTHIKDDRCIDFKFKK